MISKITLENFKAFKDASIELKPITILVGPNNGGKSSLLQSISLIKQTLRGGGEVLTFRGYLQNLGDFDSIVHQNSSRDNIRLRFDFEDGTFFDFRAAKNPSGKVVVKEFSCDTGKFKYTLKNIKISDIKDDKVEYYEAKPYEITPYQEDTDYLFPIDLVKFMFVKETFFFKIRTFLTSKAFEIISRPKRALSPKEEKGYREENLRRLYDFYQNFERISSDFYSTIKQKFENIQYIGPIRATGERSYEVGTFDHVGFKGDHAVQMIAKDAKLKGKTQDVLKNLEIANALETVEYPPSKNLVIKLTTDITDKGVNIADLGCGTSQILPPIVQSLYSQENSMVVIEQPETHLHPKVQADFASFVVDILKSKSIQFLIETHSEYFIERIRTCILRDPSLAEKVVIYYVQQNKNAKQSEIQTIEIDSKGEYSELPEGYLINFRLEEMDEQMDLMLGAGINEKIPKEE